MQLMALVDGKFNICLSFVIWCLKINESEDPLIEKNTILKERKKNLTVSCPC
jgi:hypothetical protein